MDVVIVLFLTVDILLFIIKWIWESMQPKALTFLELFNFFWDQREEILRILKEENEKAARQQLENFLKLMDVLKKREK